MKFVYSAKRTSDLMINMLIQISHEIVKMLILNHIFTIFIDE